MSEHNSARLVGGPSPMALKIANVISERNALRADLKAASRQIEQEQKIAVGLQGEFDRMRAALEELAKDGCVIGWADGRTCLERPPNISKIVGICTGCIAMRALNPQPAQQEKA